jgi:hypothetical protein
MKSLLSILVIIFCSGVSFAQKQMLPPLPTQAQKDSLAAVTCAMKKASEKYRVPPYTDSIARAYGNKDSLAIVHFGILMTQADTPNYSKLVGILYTFGYPSEKLIGPGACDLTQVMMHWAMEYPEWFNDPKYTAIFKREVQRGNLPKYIIDNAHYNFIMHTGHDTEYMELTNVLRKAVGLKLYTEAQFMRLEKLPEPKP